MLRRLLRRRRRPRLQVNDSGYWYIGLTILLGVTALASGNNVLYLIESVVMGGLIASGVLAERSILVVRTEIFRRPAIAGAQSSDTIRIHNKSRFPVFCVEIGEWADGKFTPIAFAPWISGRATVVLPSLQRFEQRGEHRWEAIAIGTSHPFGFARKLRYLDTPGRRVVWPSYARLAAQLQALGDRRMGQKVGTDVSEGEVREMNHDDDPRMIVWTLSARGGEPMVRNRRAESADPEVTLDLRGVSGEEFERAVSRAAHPFHEQPAGTGSGTLILKGHRETRKIHGRERALDSLALAKPEGSAA